MILSASPSSTCSAPSAAGVSSPMVASLMVWFVGCVVVPIEPDRGHRLEMCERNVTSSDTTRSARPGRDHSGNPVIEDGRGGAPAHGLCMAGWRVVQATAICGAGVLLLTPCIQDGFEVPRQQGFERLHGRCAREMLEEVAQVLEGVHARSRGTSSPARTGWHWPGRRPCHSRTSTVFDQSRNV